VLCLSRTCLDYRDKPGGDDAESHSPIGPSSLPGLSRQSIATHPPPASSPRRRGSILPRSSAKEWIPAAAGMTPRLLPRSQPPPAPRNLSPLSPPPPHAPYSTHLFRAGRPAA